MLPGDRCRSGRGSALKVLAACDDLAADGIYPGPAALNERLHGHRKSNLNGHDTKIRALWLRQNGYVQEEAGGRWYLPEPAIVDFHDGVAGDLAEVHRACRGRYRIGGYIMAGVHPPEACGGEGCPIHHPSLHHMRGWPLIWRGSGPFDIWQGFERQCPHGIGHLDPDTAAFLLRVGEFVPPHGCDGCCCREPEAPGFDHRATLIPRRRIRDVLRDMLDRLLYVP